MLTCVYVNKWGQKIYFPKAKCKMSIVKRIIFFHFQCIHFTRWKFIVWHEAWTYAPAVTQDEISLGQNSLRKETVLTFFKFVSRFFASFLPLLQKFRRRMEVNHFLLSLLSPRYAAAVWAEPCNEDLSSDCVHRASDKREPRAKTNFHSKNSCMPRD